MQVEKTIPEEIQLSNIRGFLINMDGLTIDIHLDNGKSYTLDRDGFLGFWNNSMTAPQRTVVKQFILQLSALATDVDVSKITGEFGQN